MRKGHSQRRVGLLIETSTTYGREILAGIAKYQSGHTRWSVYLDERELRAEPPTWFLSRRWDGIICRSTTTDFADSVQAKRIPAVDLNDQYSSLGLPRIRSDMREIGRLGAQHLHERGFRHFAFCGFKNETWSAERLAGFQSEIQRLNLSLSFFESAWRGKGVPKWDADQGKIMDWIAALPKPVGIMACNDVRGQHVLNACQDAGFYIPEQVAVLGVDNNELLCNFCNPPLSSIQPNPRRIGFEAAAMLDLLMSGQSIPSHEQLIEPIGVVIRQSSDALGIADPDVVAAIALMREQACFGLTVDQVVEHVSVSRSHLERTFRKYLHHSPQVEIRWTQVRKVKQLLMETELPLASIARLTGFDHTEYMTVVFKRLTGQSPSQFRKTVTNF